MRAVRVHGPGDLRVDDVPRPQPEFGEVVVDVEAVGICTTDQKLAARSAPGDGPRVLGHEIVGRVAALGEGVAGWEPGTRVVVAPNVGCGRCRWCLQGQPQVCPDFRAFGIHRDGGMAEAIRIDRAAVERGHLIPVPDRLHTRLAALVEPAGCVLQGLQESGLEAGESVLIVGGGVMGRLHVALARTLGAGTVILSDPNAVRLAHARQLGADVTVEARSDDLSATVMDATGGRGVDVVAVTVGSVAALAEAAALLARGGRLNAFAGVPAEQGAWQVSPNDLHYKYQRLLGTTGCSLRVMQRVLDLLTAGRTPTDGLVSGSWRLEDAHEAFEAAASTEHARVLLWPGGVPAGEEMATPGEASEGSATMARRAAPPQVDASRRGGPSAGGGS